MRATLGGSASFGATGCSASLGFSVSLVNYRFSALTLVVLFAACGTDVSSLDPGTREGRDTDNDSGVVDAVQPDVAQPDVAQPDVDDTTPLDVVIVPDVDAVDDADEDGTADASDDGTTDGTDEDAGTDVQPDVPVAPPNCGDGVVDRDEECDDGNDVATDDCTNFCTIPRCGDGVLSTEIGEVEEREPLVTNPFGVTGYVCDTGSNCPGGECNVTEVDFAAEHGICQALGHIRAVSVVWGGDVGATDEVAPRAWNWGCFGFECGEGPREESDGACGAGSMLVSIVCESRVSEVCDDGAANGVGPNECRPGCELPVCGDGVTDDAYGEDCDDQNDIQNDGCNNCRFPSCGDGVLQPGEACDDANDDDTDGCLSICQFPICGDGIISEGEICDNGDDNGDFPDGCRNTCEPARCGDFILDTGEECDDGNDIADDGCSNNCRLPACGDGVLQGDEQCDDGNDDEFDGCSTLCLLPVCGDGVIQATLPAVDEFYDFESGAIDAAFETAANGWQIDGNAFEGAGAARSGGVAASQTSTLSRTLTLDDPATLSFALRVSSESCCDRLELFVNGTELQDWGGEVAWTEVTFDLEPGETTIEWRYRKDGSVDTGEDAAWVDNIRLLSDAPEPEECDEGEANADIADVCRTTCRLPTCTDGIVDTGEECDDGNLVQDDGCSNLCRLPACGDGVQQGDEDCDDGNDDNTDACLPDCTFPVCGDGIVQIAGPVVDETFDFEDATLPGTGTWTIVEEGNGGGFAARAATIGANADSILAWTVSMDADATLSFDRKVSSESCCDSLELRIDGTLVEAWGGALDWETVTFDVAAGDHLIEWRYEKDGSVNTGDDTAWIDNVSLVSGELRNEECDDGDANADVAGACRTTCLLPACMDGIVDDGEECDDGNDVADDGCSNNCRLPACGDGVQQGDEECDDGNDDDTDACRTDCLAAFCGDGNIQPFGPLVNERFDFSDGLPAALVGNWRVVNEGPDGGPVARAATIAANQESVLDWTVSLPVAATLSFDRRVSSESCCDSLEYRLDGAIVETWQGEVAWETVRFDLPAGDHVIRWRYEKDGSVNTGDDTAWIDNISLISAELSDEECDDGEDNADIADACRTNCSVPACTDGIVDTGEECDDGNTVEDDGCSNICRLPACGDGVVQGDEECDDGNDDNDDACSNVCELPRCGDGILNTWTIGTLEQRDFESGALPPGFTGDWIIAAGGAAGSEFAMTNADIGNSQTSTVTWDVSIDAAGTLRFDRRVSSENTFDFLRFFVDGAEVDAWSGTLDWENVSFDLTPGDHTLEWRFTKDSSLSVGDDAGFIDNIMLSAGVETTDTCDDGNTDDGDGCSSICQIEE